MVLFDHLTRLFNVPSQTAESQKQKNFIATTDYRLPTTFHPKKSEGNGYGKLRTIPGQICSPTRGSGPGAEYRGPETAGCHARHHRGSHFLPRPGDGASAEGPDRRSLHVPTRH